MTILDDIKQGIITRVSTVLGASYKELSYIEDVALNNWKQVTDGYAVRSLSGTEFNGVNKAYTMNHVYEVALSGQYIEASVNDKKLVTLKETLLGLCLDIYKDLINTKAGTPASVLNITNLSLAEIEIDDEAKVTVQRMKFDIVYRIIL